MLLHAFGAAPSASPDNMMPQMPPHLRRPGPGRGGPQQDDFAQHMRGGPHPGMRAAAEMKKQAGATQGSGKGMMSVVLPMYAVGIVIYLIYTMTKVFGKSNEKQEDKDYMSSHFKQRADKGQGQQQRRLMVDDEAIQQQQQQQQPQDNRKRQKDLERLLMKADKDKITELEMRQLKQRLLETEAQMTRILQAMETVAEKVEGQTTTQDKPISGEAQLEKNLNHEQQQQQQQRPVKLKPNDASPDLDSYDFVRHSSGEQSPVMVENINAAHEDVEDDDDRQEQEVNQPELETEEDEEENIDDVELEYEPSPGEDEDEDEDEEEEEDIMIGQQEERKQEGEEDHPDLRKRRPPSNQKHKVKRVD